MEKMLNYSLIFMNKPQAVKKNMKNCMKSFFFKLNPTFFVRQWFHKHFSRFLRTVLCFSMKNNLTQFIEWKWIRFCCSFHIKYTFIHIYLSSNGSYDILLTVTNVFYHRFDDCIFVLYLIFQLTLCVIVIISYFLYKRSVSLNNFFLWKLKKW